MSHNATNWAIRQRGLKPATKLVLWHLCDRHHPDYGCFPSQDNLAHDCEMSRSSLNDHLKILEDRGLIRREQRYDDATQRVKSTSYAFAFEFSEETQDVVEPCPNFGHGAVSEKEPKPCPKNGESRVRNSDTNSVREPVREPVSNPPPPTSTRDGGGGDFNILWKAWPDQMRPDNVEAAQAAFDKLPPDDQQMAVDLVKTFIRAQVLRKKRALMMPYLRQRLFAEHYGAPELDADGDYVITPDRPEWSVWLGNIRDTFGETGVQSAVRHRKIVRKTRWPVQPQPAAQEVRP